MRTQLIAALTMLTALALCSCATPYRPAKGGKGYTESQISSNEFSIGFQANDRTSLETVYDFALLRSAEVALEHGYHFFAVTDAANTSSAKSYLEHQRYYASAFAPGGLGVPAPSGYIVDVRQRRIDFQPGTLLRIKCYIEKPAKPFTYDAAEQRRMLRKKQKLAP